MCTGSSQSKNQTPKEIYEFLAHNKGKENNGIGFFLVPNPEAGIHEFKKVTVADLSLTETLKRGLNCEACKFLPYGMPLQHPEKGLKHINSLDDLNDFRCEFGCAGGYGDGCWAANCYCTYYNGCI
jgi:hypothetical protein